MSSLKLCVAMFVSILAKHLAKEIITNFVSSIGEEVNFDNYIGDVTDNIIGLKGRHEDDTNEYEIQILDADIHKNKSKNERNLTNLRENEKKPEKGDHWFKPENLNKVKWWREPAMWPSHGIYIGLLYKNSNSSVV